jgi:hypothetical protein
VGRPFHRRAPQNARLLREAFNVDYALLQCRLGVRMRGPFACDGGTGFRQSCAQRCEIIDPLAITACASSCRRYPPDDPHATDGAV